MDNLVGKWDESYERLENNIIYPKEEVIKFLNRYVVQKLSLDGNNKDLIKNKKQSLKALDFGCGVGRQTILMEEFGIDSWGVDISKVAIEQAKKNAELLGYKNQDSRFIKIDNSTLPFEDNFFDITISESCIDSLYFDEAVKIFKELDRVTNKYIFFSVIGSEASKKGPNYIEDMIVKTSHEEGTIQSFYNIDKIESLIKNISFKIADIRKVTETSEIIDYINVRYFVVLERK